MGEGICRQWGRLCQTRAVGGGQCGPKRPQKKNSQFFQRKLAGHPGCSQPAKTACQSRKPIENGVGKPTAHVGWFWSQTPNFEPIELLVPPLPPPDTAVVASFLVKKTHLQSLGRGQGGASLGSEPVAGTAQCPTGTKTQLRPPNSEFRWDRPHPKSQLTELHWDQHMTTLPHRSPTGPNVNSQGSQGKREGAPCCSAASCWPRPTTQKNKMFMIHPRR